MLHVLIRYRRYAVAILAAIAVVLFIGNFGAIVAAVFGALGAALLSTELGRAGERTDPNSPRRTPDGNQPTTTDPDQSTPNRPRRRRR